MKRWTALLLAAVLCLSFAACGKNLTIEPVSVGEEQDADAEAPGGEDTAVTATEAPKPKEEKWFSMHGTIEETVLVDEEEIRITAAELRFGDAAATLTLRIENRLEETVSVTLGAFQYQRMYVNGYMLPDLSLFAKVPAGETSEEEIEYKYSMLSALGIHEIAELGLSFFVSTESAGILLRTDPAPVKTSIADSYDYASEQVSELYLSMKLQEACGITVESFDETMLYSKGGVSIVSSAVISDSDGGKSIVLEVENRSGEGVDVTATSVYLEGIAGWKTWSSLKLCPDKKALVKLDLTRMLQEQKYQTLGLQDPNRVSFDFEVLDWEYHSLCPAQPLTFVLSKDADRTFTENKPLLYENDLVKVYLLDVAEDSRRYNDDVHLFLMVENLSDEEILAGIQYKSSVANGAVIRGHAIDETIRGGRIAVLDVKYLDDSLKENGINSFADLESVGVTLEIMDSGYHTLFSQKLEITP